MIKIKNYKYINSPRAADKTALDDVSPTSVVDLDGCSWTESLPANEKKKEMIFIAWVKHEHFSVDRLI